MANGMPARSTGNSFTEPGEKFDLRNADTVDRWMKVKVAQSDSATPWTVAHGILQARILEWVILQGIFPKQGSNPGLLHCRWILYQLSHKGRWKEWWKTVESPCLDFLSEVLFI